MKYDEFLAKKQVRHDACGFDVVDADINLKLFEWQRKIVKWACFKGQAALFEACGLGKTPQQLEWARMVAEHTGGDVLILAPLAVAAQTAREGHKFGIDVNICREQADVKPGINVTNYEMLAKFNPDHFTGVVLDESSILKSFAGKTKQALMAAFRETPFKLACTATPSPNDLMELLNQADFLGIMPQAESLMRWFIHDSGQTAKWRIKGHAQKEFWQWVSSWAVCINSPADIGYPDDGFVLPKLHTVQHVLDQAHDFSNGQLFADYSNMSATELFRTLKKSADSRTDEAADLINGDEDIWVVWCNTNDESALLAKKIDGAVEIKGAMPPAKKEAILEDFAAGKIRVLVTKASMTGFGLNWQHCHKMAFVGLSYSFEQRYQAIRRCWRFGQEKEVFDHVIMAPPEVPVWRTVQKKEEMHGELERNMVNNISEYSDLNQHRLKLVPRVKREKFTGTDWSIIVGDSCEEIKTIPDESVHFQIFSPPFSNLYIYSDAVADMGNTKDDSEFFNHFDYLIPELYRILVPGRLCAVHCIDIPQFKWKTGKISLVDFPGKIIRHFEKAGFMYHSRITIWKDPVTEMQRTKALGLLHAQIKRDSSVSRQGLPDYLLVFRKWPDGGETSGPSPVLRPEGFCGYVGENPPSIGRIEGDEEYSINVWQRYASPVWFDIQQTNVLNCRAARDDRDEKHICPLQLDLIKRAVHLWTNEGDTVFTPFAGIGSELYGALEMGRKGLGIELKPAYAKQAARYLKELEERPEQLELFG
jgi:DNA modification methylase